VKHTVKYTVVGLYPNCLTDYSTTRDGSFVYWSSAKTPKRAARAAMRWAMAQWDPDWKKRPKEIDPDDYIEILCVFIGRHYDHHFEA